MAKLQSFFLHILPTAACEKSFKWQREWLQKIGNFINHWRRAWLSPATGGFPWPLVRFAAAVTFILGRSFLRTVVIVAGWGGVVCLILALRLTIAVGSRPWGAEVKCRLICNWFESIHKSGGWHKFSTLHLVDRWAGSIDCSIAHAFQQNFSNIFWQLIISTIVGGYHWAARPGKLLGLGDRGVADDCVRPFGGSLLGFHDFWHGLQVDGWPGFSSTWKINYINWTIYVLQYQQN